MLVRTMIKSLSKHLMQSYAFADEIDFNSRKSEQLQIMNRLRTMQWIT